MDEFFYYLKQRLFYGRYLLRSLSVKKIRVIAESLWAMLIRRPRSGKVPVILIIKLTSRCNFSCIMCPKTSRSINFYNDPVDIDFIKLKNLLEQNAKYVTLVQLHGGEPLMHRQITDILDLLNSLNLMYTITTNGHYLTSEILTRLTENCLRVIISIDAVTPELYARIRKGGNLAHIIENIELLNQIKARVKSALPVIRIVMAVFTYNLGEMTRLIQFCHEQKINMAIFQEGILYDNPEIEQEQTLGKNRQAVEKAVRETKALARRLHVPVRFDFDFWSERPARAAQGAPLKRCFYLYFSMLLQERFNATYCFGSYDCVFPMSGDLAQTWNGTESYFYSARMDLKHNIIPNYCMNAYNAGLNCILNSTEYS